MSQDADFDPSASRFPDPAPNDPLVLSWSPLNALEFGWRTMRTRPGFIGVVVVGTLLAWAPDVVAALIEGNRALTAPSAVVRLAGFVLQVFIEMNLMRMALDIARGRPTRFADLFRSGPILGVFVTGLLVGLGVLAGMLLLVIPGLVLAAGWTNAMFFAVDQRVYGTEAIRASWESTMGRKWAIAAYWGLAFGVLLAGLIACGVGVFLSFTILHLATAYTYLSLTGQAVRIPRPAES